MKLKKCTKCNLYTLKEICSECNSKTKEAHYKFIKIKDAPKSSNPKKLRKN
jgi:RNA polymerase subunit RPABC4/transcription elongation factor Spt4